MASDKPPIGHAGGFAPPDPNAQAVPQSPPVPGAPGGTPPSAYYAQPVSAKTNGFAVASLVLGILWIYWVGSALAIIFGAVAMSQIGKSAGTQSGRGMAIAGLVLGLVGAAVFVLLLVTGVVLSSGSGVSSS